MDVRSTMFMEIQRQHVTEIVSGWLRLSANMSSPASFSLTNFHFLTICAIQHITFFIRDYCHSCMSTGKDIPYLTFSYFQIILGGSGNTCSCTFYFHLKASIQNLQWSRLVWSGQPRGKCLFTSPLILLCIIQSHNQFPTPDVPFSHAVKTCIHVL